MIHCNALGIETEKSTNEKSLVALSTAPLFMIGHAGEWLKKIRYKYINSSGIPLAQKNRKFCHLQQYSGSECILKWNKSDRQRQVLYDTTFVN